MGCSSRYSLINLSNRILERPPREAVFLFCAGHFANFRYWPLADISGCAAHVRFKV